MALVAFFSFDNVSSLAEFDLKMAALFPLAYTRDGSQHSLAAGQGRWGETVWRQGVSSPLNLTVPTHATYTVGMWTRITTFGTSVGNHFIIFKDGGTDQVRIDITSDGIIRAVGPTVVIAASVTGTIVVGTWHFVEVQMTIHNSAGSVELRVDGVTVASATGVNTQASGTAQITIIRLFAFVSGAPEVDRQHIYILDGSGASLNDFIGFVRVVTDVPTANGSVIEWTPSGAGANFEQIDEAIPNNDTDYNSSGVVTDDDLFTMQAISEAGLPLAVQDFVVARKDAVGAREIALTMKSGAAALNVGAAQVLAETYKYFVATRIQNPDGPADWTDKATVDAAESGYRIVT